MSDEFWEATSALMAEGVVDEGTIMGSACIRARGEFVAMPHHRGPGLVVKLPRDRVDELIDAGDGEPFAPAGKVFREWVLITGDDLDQWEALLWEAVSFVSGETVTPPPPAGTEPLAEPGR